MNKNAVCFPFVLFTLKAVAEHLNFIFTFHSYVIMRATLKMCRYYASRRK